MSDAATGTGATDRATGAAARIADTLLRGVGGQTLILRMPSAAVPADVAEQLGLGAPEFQDVALNSVVWRVRPVASAGKGARWELLVSATAVAALVGSLAYESASVLFADAFGVLSGGELLTIESATWVQAFGQPYLYRLVLRGPLARVV